MKELRLSLSVIGVVKNSIIYMFKSGSSDMKNEIASSPISIIRVINETSSAGQKGRMLQVIKQPSR
jgi:hypothetical protein